MNRQLQVALVVERHRAELTEGVLAVEHPAVGTRQQRIRNVANALLDRYIGLGARPGALNPLPLQIRRDLAAGERYVARVLHLDCRPWNGAGRVEERDALTRLAAGGATRDARGHHRAPV